MSGVRGLVHPLHDAFPRPQALIRQLRLSHGNRNVLSANPITNPSLCYDVQVDDFNIRRWRVEQSVGNRFEVHRLGPFHLRFDVPQFEVSRQTGSRTCSTCRYIIVTFSCSEAQWYLLSMARFLSSTFARQSERCRVSASFPTQIYIIRKRKTSVSTLIVPCHSTAVEAR